jgi:micrococcal nuclease
VIDGDTIGVSLEGSVQTVRYIGIDAPEREAPLGPAATATNRALVGGEIVYLERDVSAADEFGRLLRYVYLPDGTFVNGEMVRRGLAEASAYPPDVKRQDVLDALEAEAREAARGIWKLDAAPAPGKPNLQIVAVDAEAEVVDLINAGDDVVVLDGWTLVSEKGSQACRLAGRLAPGETLRVWSMAADAGRGGLNCGFGEPIWNNDEPDEALLYAPDGTLVDRRP